MDIKSVRDYIKNIFSSFSARENPTWPLNYKTIYAFNGPWYNEK